VKQNCFRIITETGLAELVEWHSHGFASSIFLLASRHLLAM